MKSAHSRIEQWAGRATTLILAVTVLALPLFIAPTGWDGWRFPKVLIVRAAAIAIVTISAVNLVWSADRSERIRAVLDDRLVRASLILIGLTLLSAGLSPQPMVSLWASVDVVAGLALFFAARRQRHMTGSDLLLWVLLVPALLTSVVIGAQTFNLWHPMMESVEAVERLPSTDALILRKAALLGNRDDVGMYLMIPFLVSLHLLLARRRRKFLSGLAAAVIGVSIVVTSTLTAIVAASVGAALLLYRQGRRHLKHPARVALAASAIVVIAAGLLLATSDVHRRFDHYAERLRAGDYQGATGDRLLSFGSAALLIVENPLTGVGPGRYPIEQLEASTKLRSSWPSLFGTPTRTWFDMAHNDYLEIAAEGGLLVLAACLAWVVIYSPSRHDQYRDKDLALALIVSVGLAALVLFPLQIAGVYGTAAVATGAAAPPDREDDGGE